MTEDYETAGIYTGTWESFPNGMFSGCSLPRYADMDGFEWQNIDTLDANTYNESYLNTSTYLSISNPDYKLQNCLSNQSNILEEEERLNPINCFLERLFDFSEQVSVPNHSKPESFHYFDDIFLNESKTVSDLNHEVKIKPKEDIQAYKRLFTCKSVNEKSEQVEDIDSSPSLKKPRLETPSHFPSFKVRKEKLGDRITALQQLVSPFGKTDTASVLHDAIEYIKFLQEQITVSTNPQLNSKGSGEQTQWSDKSGYTNHDQETSPRQDLRSRGLCLMPISSTFSTSPQHLDTSSFWY